MLEQRARRHSNHVNAFTERSTRRPRNSNKRGSYFVDISRGRQIPASTVTSEGGEFGEHESQRAVRLSQRKQRARAARAVAPLTADEPELLTTNDSGRQDAAGNVTRETAEDLCKSQAAAAPTSTPMAVEAASCAQLPKPQQAGMSAELAAQLAAERQVEQKLHARMSTALEAQLEAVSAVPPYAPPRTAPRPANPHAQPVPGCNVSLQRTPSWTGNLHYPQERQVEVKLRARLKAARKEQRE